MRAAMYPKATVELLPAAEYGGEFAAGEPIGAVLHVNAGEGDPYSWWLSELWTNPASAHWQVMKTGEVRQEVPADHQAWHNVAGIPFWHGIETEGQPWEQFTEAQLLALGDLYAWGHVEWGWPLSLSEGVWVPGFGWHGMGGMAWGGHFGCPGELRKACRGMIVEKAAQLVGAAPGWAPGSLAGEPTVALNATGQTVMLLQHVINVLMRPRPLLAEDGQYGPATQLAVRQVQAFFHLVADGVAGPQTWGLLAFLAKRAGRTF